VSSNFAHFGEERCPRGKYGSGKIFFGWCNLRCVFCQNYEISWTREGRSTKPERLAEMMLQLQEHRIACSDNCEEHGMDALL
jgi:putative pyruvate formate lyase activating enzyme